MKYFIHQFADLVRASEPLEKAVRPPGAGWQKTPKGYKRAKGATWEYWYPGDAVPQKPRKKARRKPSQPLRRKWDPQVLKEQKSSSRGRVEAGKPMEGIASTAPKGSAKWKLETGQFSMVRKRVFSRDQDDFQRRKTGWAPDVPDSVKMELVEAYQPLIKSLSRKLSRQFKLPFSQAMLADMQSAGAEGLLVAIDQYKGGTTFNPKLVVHDLMRVHASREFLGFQLPEIHARNLARYVAARYQAAQKLKKEEPTVEEVLPFFDLRKRHIHAGLPATNTAVRVGTYPKTEIRAVTLPNGKEVRRRMPHPKAGQPIYETLRNAQIPDFKGYELPQHLGRRGTATASDRQRVAQPSKYEWAQMYDDFLKGQKGISAFDATVVMPGAGIGYGFSVEDQIVLRHDISNAGEKLSELGPVQLKARSDPRVSKDTTYRVRDLGDVVMRRIGANQDPHTIQELARVIPIEKKKAGQWVRVPDREARGVMQKFVEKGMQALPTHTEGEQATRLATRAQKLLAPKAAAPRGPTWAEFMDKEASKLSQADVEHYRENYRGGDRDRIRRMNDRELRLEMVRHSRAARGLAKQMRQAMTATMTVERVDPLYGIARRYDPETKEWESLRVRMDYDRFFKKSALGGLSDEILRQILYFPNLMMLLTSDEPASKARTAVERMVGLVGNDCFPSRQV